MCPPATPQADALKLSHPLNNGEDGKYKWVGWEQADRDMRHTRGGRVAGERARRARPDNV